MLRLKSFMLRLLQNLMTALLTTRPLCLPTSKLAITCRLITKSGYYALISSVLLSVTWSVICFRDYMDRFLDENESAASSRASSPHNFTTSKVRPGNGIAPTMIPAQSQPVVTQPTHTVAAPTAAQSTVVTINVTNSNPISVSLTRRDPHDNIPNRQLQQQQSCVPTSVIVSGPDSGSEPPTKKLKILPGGRPKLINSMLSKPPPLKPIVSSGSPAFHAHSLGNVPLPPTGVSNFNASNSHEPSYLPVQNTPAVTDSLLFTHNK